MFVAPSPFPTGLSLKIEPDCGPQEDRKFPRIAVPQERLSCELVFYKGTVSPFVIHLLSKILTLLWGKCASCYMANW